MRVGKIIRRVNKRVYDKYSFVDYAVTADNLNPLNPTQLESQFSEITQVVQQKVVDAYKSAELDVPSVLFEPDVTPSVLLSAVDDLMNKLKSNPLNNLMNDLGNTPITDLISNLVSEDTGFLNNPLVLDCEGIESTLTNNSSSSSTDGEDEPDDSSESDESEDDTDYDDSDESTEDGIVQITYKNLCDSESRAKYPSELYITEFPIYIAEPEVVPDPPDEDHYYEFEGWFRDSSYNTIIPNNYLLEYPAVDSITLYAKFDLKDTDNPDDSSTGEDELEPLSTNAVDDENDCGQINLSWLKVILIIIIVGKILIQVLVLVYNIMKAVADIAKDAQLCWINPPSLQSLISYVMQRISAVIFQILGMILLKLWSLLDLDCMSSQTMSTLSQINAALSGFIDMMGEIESTALQMSGSDESLKETLNKAIADLTAQMDEQTKAFTDAYASLGDQLKNAGLDIKDTYTNPETYIKAARTYSPEIVQDIEGVMNSIETTKQTLRKTKQSILNLDKSVSGDTETVNAIPKNVEVITF